MTQPPAIYGSRPPAIYAPQLPSEDLSLRAPDLGENVDNLWRIILRRRWRFLSVFALICLIGAATFLSLAPRYTAHTIMVAESRQPDLAATDQVGQVMRSRNSSEPDIESEMQLMMSSRALLKIVQDLHLDQDPEFVAPVRRSSKLAQLRYYWNKLIEGDWQASLTGPKETPDSGKGSEEAIVELLKKRLKIDQIARSTTVDISFTAHDPQIAAKFTNAVAAAYIVNRDELRKGGAQRATKYLSTRSAELQAELAAAERAVESFRQASVLRDGRDIDQLRAEMEKTNAQLAAARIAKGIAETRLEAVEARVRQVGIVGALESGESRLNDRLREMEADTRAKLAGNAADLGAAHPEFRRAQRVYAATQAQVAYEAQARLSKLRSEVTIADRQIQLLEGSLQTFRTTFDRLSTALITLRGLESQAAVSRAVYEAFLNRVKVTEQVGFNEAESWILSPATAPANPSFPNTMLFLGATLFLASGAALSLVLLAEREAGQTILSSQHILDRGLKPLGIVPDCGNGTASLKQALVASTQRGNSAFSESIGAIFTSLMELGRRERSSLVLLVTSALPFEGKSTTIVALAAKMASAGKRVLVIDADLRAPRLHHAFGIANKHGLTECLDSSRPLGDSIYRDAETGISVLTAGPSRPKPQNVLRSQQLFDAVETFKTSYDFILVDSPPVLPFSDARILVPLTDYCIFVMHWGKTRWTSGMHALRLLRDSEARLAGIVVSNVNVKKLATYGFADSEIYGRAYKRYSAGTGN